MLLENGGNDATLLSRFFFRPPQSLKTGSPLRGLRAGESRMVSTAKEDLTFAGPVSALERFGGKELSDHNAVWAMCGPK